MKTQILAFVLAAAGLLLTGCASTFQEIKPLSDRPPPADRPTALALGDLQVTDARWSEAERRAMAHAFELGVEKWCVAHKTLEFCPATPPTNGTIRPIILNGTITELEKGSAAARLWVGMGAGQERVLGEFSLHGPDGTRLTAFVARESYLGGTGIGGWDVMDLQELVGRLGQLVAETTDKWLRGGKLR